VQTNNQGTEFQNQGDVHKNCFTELRRGHGEKITGAEKLKEKTPRYRVKKRTKKGRGKHKKNEKRKETSEKKKKTRQEGRFRLGMKTSTWHRGISPSRKARGVEKIAFSAGSWEGGVL